MLAAEKRMYWESRGQRDSTIQTFSVSSVSSVPSVAKKRNVLKHHIYELCMKYHRGKKKRCCRGVQTLELVIVLPILLIATFAVYQFGVAMIIDSAITHAASVAAREAGKGASMDDVARSVDEVLRVHHLTVGADVSVVLEEGNGSRQQRGTLPCTPPATPTLGPGDVRVTISVNMTAAPYLNGLTSYGIDFTNKTFTVSAAARRE